jgi:hypothetical protein
LPTYTVNPVFLWITILDKDSTKMETICTETSKVVEARLFHEILANTFQRHKGTLYTMTKGGFTVTKAWFIIRKSVSVMHRIYSLGKNPVYGQR